MRLRRAHVAVKLVHFVALGALSDEQHAVVACEFDETASLRLRRVSCYRELEEGVVCASIVLGRVAHGVIQSDELDAEAEPLVELTLRYTLERYE